MSLFRRTPPAPPAEVVLLTKPGCHLCHKARASVAKITAELGSSYRELNILEDEELNRRYWDRIPVTLVEDRVVDVWHVDEDRLRRAVRH